MSWHLILMIVFSILYICWRIYVYSTSLTFNYWTTNYKEHTKLEWCRIKIRRFIKELKFILKGYWDWYGLKHTYPVIIYWLIYGGIFIW